MLFENRKQISAKDLMVKYASIEDYNKILKKPSFEIAADRKKIDRVNGGRIKTPKSSMMRSHFIATDRTTSLKVEIRYAETSNTKIVGERVVDDFVPRYVETKGAAFAFQNNIDLAVYIFLNPNNNLSPLRDPLNKTKGKFDFVDTKKRSQDKMATINSFATAMEHAKLLNEERMMILAKGLNIKGIDKKEPDEVRADVMEFAMKHPKIYNEKANTELTYIEGRIINLIDKGAVKLTTVGSIRRWTWVRGEREGEHILDIQNVTQDPKQALKNHFFSDINKYMNLLNDMNTEIGVMEKAKRDLQIIEEAHYNSVVSPAHAEDRVIGDALPAHLRENNDKSPYYELPKDNNAAMELLTGFRTDDKKATWVHVKQLFGAIENGDVTGNNLRDWVKLNMGY